jgi:hypothetical protein
MQRIESQWIRDRLAELPDEDLFPIMDVGSSTLEYRTVVQPYVEANVFAPLRRRDGKVWHVDAKDAPGVDLVGDLLDPDFRARLRDLGIRSATVCNVLAHLGDPHPVAAAISDVVPTGGHILVTGAYQLPQTMDPIDTMFRPTVEEAAALFPGTRIVTGEIIDAGNWRQWDRAERGRTLPRTVARLMVPVYRPSKWREVAVQVPYFFKHLKTFAVLLRKT